jgi:flagella basal body P-ring formation protein FlgA
MDSFAVPSGKRTLGRRKAESGAELRSMRVDSLERIAISRSMRVDSPERLAISRSVAACALAFAIAAAGATAAHAQDTSGAIMIPGPAETNPAAVVAMAKNAGMTVGANTGGGTNPASSRPAGVGQPAQSAQTALTPRQGGYTAAANAADAAMRAAALALDAHADAADESSGDAQNSGLIVIPGNGEAKRPAPKLTLSPSRSTPESNGSGSGSANNNASGMIVIPGNGEPKSAATPSTAAAASIGSNSNSVNRAAGSARDVVAVVVNADDASTQARPLPVRPIAAASAMPVAGMMPVSMRTTMPIRAAAIQPAFGATSGAAAGANLPPSQDPELIRTTALAFLTQQAAGLPGKPVITVVPVFPRGLAPCDTLEPFMPTGARLWGRTTVGVRCSGARPWTLYLQARVSVQATYYAAGRAVAPGEVLSAADLIPREGDLTAMPLAIVTDPSQAIGAVTLTRLAAGLPLRTDMLRGAGAILIGQTVHVVTGGQGFSISADGSAMNNATPGQQVHVKTAGGQIISGIAKDGSTVEVGL